MAEALTNRSYPFPGHESNVLHNIEVNCTYGMVKELIKCLKSSFD